MSKQMSALMKQDVFNEFKFIYSSHEQEQLSSLPSQFILKFADTYDSDLLKSYSLQKTYTFDLLKEYLEEGRVVILTDKLSNCIYGLAVSQKIVSRKKGATARIIIRDLEIKWVALGKLMSSALMMYEYTRSPKISFSQNNCPFETLEEAKDYYQAAQNIQSVISNGKETYISLSPIMKTIHDIEDVKASIYRRCGLKT